MSNRNRKLNMTREHRLPGKTYNLLEKEKAAQLRVSQSFLQKDRLKDEPLFDYMRVGKLVRYSAE